MKSRANSSRRSRTWARVAPVASARSRIDSSSRPCPRSIVTAMISALYFSLSQGIATEVSSPPEYANTMRSIQRSSTKCHENTKTRRRPASRLRHEETFRTTPTQRTPTPHTSNLPALSAVALPLQPRVRLEPFDERRRAAIVSRNDEDRVVARDRADRLRQLGPVDRQRQILRLAGTGAHDDELLRAIDPSQETRSRPLEGVERELRARDLDALTLVRAVARPLHQPELLDVARDRRLRRFAAALEQPPPHVFLAAERLAVDQLENQTLAAGFHGAGPGTSTLSTARIHGFRR